MDRELSRAVEKSTKYGQYLTQSEYYTMMKYASINGPDGNAARDALASCRYLNDEPLKYVTYRDRYAEDRYAPLGQQRVDIGGSYITSACLAALRQNFDDACYELKTLRHFRDTWLKQNYPHEIRQYYRQAPLVVKAIDRLGNHMDIYRMIYGNMVMPSVRAIENNDPEKAHEIYRRCYLELERTYLNKGEEK